MKNLTSIINEQLFENYMFDINDSLINESLNSSYLQSIASMLKKFGSKNKDGMWQNSFSGVFGPLNVEWDKIQDSDFEEYKAGDKAGIKKVRAILSSATGWINAIVLLKNVDEEGFAGMISWRGKVDFNGKKWDYTKREWTQHIERYDGYLQKYAKEDCEKYDFYYLDLGKFTNDDIRKTRRDEKEDMILQGDSEFYRRLAEDNRERYAKIIAKHKAEKAAKEDTVSEDVKGIVDELMNLSTTAAKNPDKYINVEYELGYAIEKVYSTNSSNNSYGLLALYKNYITAHLSMAKDGGYNFERSGQNKYKKAITSKIEEIRKDIDKIKEKIAA